MLRPGRLRAKDDIAAACAELGVGAQQHALARERLWRGWKRRGCAPYERYPTADHAALDVAAAGDPDGAAADADAAAASSLAKSSSASYLATW